MNTMQDYTVRYSDRRTISISVTREGELLVRAPHGTPTARIESLLLAHADWIEKHTKRRREIYESEKVLTEEDIARLKKEARAYFLPLTEKYAALLHVTYKRITITGAKTRFGSCSSAGNIAYSYRLMLYPEVAREYVVVHELAHRREMNHSKSFYAIVQSVLPDYKERNALLKRSVPQPSCK